jgi:hypothetical protein
MELVEITKPNDTERLEILKLFYGVFPGDQELLTKKFTHMLYSNGNVRVIVIKNDQKEVVSTLFLIEGKMNFEAKQYVYCNMSYYVTEVQHRGGQAARLISDYVVNIIQKEYDLVIGFPRHIMQGYWGRYGFTEITNSKCFELVMDIDKADVLSPLFYRVATDEDCPMLSELSTGFKNLNQIRLERSVSKWSYLIKILQSSGGKVVIGVNSEGMSLGYAAIQNSKIVELSCPDLSISNFISKDFFRYLGLDVISLDVRGIPTTQLGSRDFFVDEFFSRCTPQDRELWDLMFFSKHPQIHAHLLSRESLDSPLEKTPPNSQEGHFFSDFTILDQQ